MPLGTKPTTCRGCPLENLGLGFVQPSGPRDAKLLAITATPDAETAYSGIPFYGRAGQTLTKWLSLAGIQRSSARLAHLTQCWVPAGEDEEGNPKGAKAPPPAAIDHCRRAHWGQELEGRRVVLAVGGQAVSELVNPVWNADQAGAFVELSPGHYAVGIEHPNAILAGAWGRQPAQIIHLRRVRGVLDGAAPSIPEFGLPAPGAELFPTLSQLQDWSCGIGPRGISVDVESAGPILRCVSLCRVDDLVGVVLWFRADNGELWPWNDQLESVVRWFAELMADESILKTAHNGQAFDVPEQLERTGFIVRGFEWDTLLAQHVLLPESQKGLEPMSGVYLGCAGWKALVRHTDEDAEGDFK